MTVISHLFIQINKITMNVTILLIATFIYNYIISKLAFVFIKDSPKNASQFDTFHLASKSFRKQ